MPINYCDLMEAFSHFIDETWCEALCQWSIMFPGRRGVTLKPDIKVETVNKETHSLEEEAASASTATRMVKAMYSVSIYSIN